MIPRLPLVLLMAFAATGCVVDNWQEPVPGREAQVRINPGAPRVDVAWPVSYRRSSIYVVENASGQPIETMIVEFLGDGLLREIQRVEIQAPAGATHRILPAPHGIFSVRVMFGTPGTVLLREGEILRVRFDILGEPGMSTAEFTVPGVTPK
jgi:hypothetical protein